MSMNQRLRSERETQNRYEADRAKVDYKELSRHCDGSRHCHCPLIGYENADGICRHPACMGPMPECGKAVFVVPNGEL